LESADTITKRQISKAILEMLPISTLHVFFSRKQQSASSVAHNPSRKWPGFNRTDEILGQDVILLGKWRQQTKLNRRDQLLFVLDPQIQTSEPLAQVKYSVGPHPQQGRLAAFRSRGVNKAPHGPEPLRFFYNHGETLPLDR
jgi:hypothetical protein